MFVWGLMKIGFYDKECLDKFIHYTSRSAQGIDHALLQKLNYLIDVLRITNYGFSKLWTLHSKSKSLIV